MVGFLFLSAMVATLATAATSSSIPKARQVIHRHGGVSSFHWTVPMVEAKDCIPSSDVNLDDFIGVPNFQTAFQVQVFNLTHHDTAMADTEKVISSKSTGVTFPEIDRLVHTDDRFARTFYWRVRTWSVCSHNSSAWSKLESFTVAPSFDATATPIYGPAESKYAFLRKEVELKSAAVSKVSVMITAAQFNALEKLLGAYRLYVNGDYIGIGPGRGDVANTEMNHTMFDMFDVTESVKKSSSKSVAFAIQSYQGGTGQGKVLVSATITYSDGTVTQISGDSSWKAWDATDYFNPGSQTTGGAYDAPQENIDASKNQGDWKSVGFDDSHWVAATEVQPFGFTVVQKETAPLNLTSGVTPSVMTKLSDTVYFFDFETEIMGGIQLKVPPSTTNPKYIQITLSEELNGPYGSGELLYPMRTGNHYRYMWKLNPGKESVFELHEYALFRYGVMVFCNDILSCKPPGPAAPSPAPTPPAGLCDVAAENNKLHLGCPSKGQSITKVLFANYGCSTGTCTGVGANNTFAVNKSCSADNSLEVVSKHCLGKSDCFPPAENSEFIGCEGCLPDGDPCHHGIKHLSAAVECSSTLSTVHDEPSISLSAWTVRYDWNDESSSFTSSNEMLNRVYDLCRNTLKVTSLDTTTDSNTRERLPYEADGFITGNSRYAFQQDTMWQLHSTRHNIYNPTWPTEWRQFMPLMIHEHWMQSGDVTLINEFWDTLVNSTQVNCVNKTTQLVDFSKCARVGQRDLVDWPQDARDGYVMTDVNTVINAFMVGGLRTLVALANATGRDGSSFTTQADATTKAMQTLLFNASAGLMVDGLYGAEKHSAWHAQTNTLWFDVFPQDTAAQSKALEYLKGRRIVGSVYAVYSYFQAVYQVDSDFGAVGLEMLTQCDDNSYCHMLNVNATATMEAWTRKEKPNLSWSHPWATAAVTAIVRGLMGLTATSPTYSTWKLKPQTGNLTFADLKTPTQSGVFMINVSGDGHGYTINLTAPSGTHGTVCVPKLGVTSNTVLVDMKSMKAYASGDYLCVDKITGGVHVIETAKSN